MGIGVKRPKIDANQIDSLLGSESSPANESPSPSKVINSVADVPSGPVNEVIPSVDLHTDDPVTPVVNEEIRDVSNFSFDKKEKPSYSCEQKLRVVLPALDSILENKSDEFSTSRTSNITLPDSLIRDLQELTLLSKKKSYARNILSNVVSTFLAAYKKDIEAAKQRKLDSQK